MDLEDGRFLVKLAREAIENYIRKGAKPMSKEKKKFEESGVFVTLHTYPDRKLRGCIGYPQPSPLVEALVDSAISAATNDYRFPPVSEGELDKIIVEITILSKPVLITAKPEEYPKKIKIGRDGLIVEHGFNSGLLLPIVPVEWGWDEEEFLSQTCVKAGLDPLMWLDKRTKVYKFTGQIFAEEKPRGDVKETKLM